MSGQVLMRNEDGGTRTLPLDVWLAPADPVDERLLDRARGPVLDVGCGPGRHVRALTQRGVLAVGIDVSPTAVALARGRGAAVLEASIFDRVPNSWCTALLLDGSVGIGGHPAALLARVAALLAPGGNVLAELDPPGIDVVRERVRLEDGEGVSHWFAWARVGADAVDGPARGAGLRVMARWHDDGRWFAELGR